MKKLLGILFLVLLISGNAYTDVATNILKLKSLNACRKCNLQGADLSRANLRKANLKKANLIGTNLSGADLEKADLSGAKLDGAKLDGAILCKTIMDSGTDNSGC